MKEPYKKYGIILAAALLVLTMVILGAFVPAEKRSVQQTITQGSASAGEGGVIQPDTAAESGNGSMTSTPQGGSVTEALINGSTEQKDPAGVTTEQGSSEQAVSTTEEIEQDPPREYSLSSPALDEYLGASGVVQWLEQHCDDYYLKTEFLIGSYAFDDPSQLLRPYGEYGEDGRMNCTGFVSHVMKSCGADLSLLTEQGQWGGYANAVSYWKLASKDEVGYYTFDSVDELLDSGIARKGDVLYLEPDWSAENTDCHIGFFWGDNSHDNKFWNSDLRGNAITEITMIDPIERIYLFPLSGK